PTLNVTTWRKSDSSCHLIPRQFLEERIQLVSLTDRNLTPTSAGQGPFQSDLPMTQQALRCNLRIMDAEYGIAGQYGITRFFRKEGRPARRAVRAATNDERQSGERHAKHCSCHRRAHR